MPISLDSLIDNGRIPGAAVASVASDGEAKTQSKGVTNNVTTQAVTNHTVFEAASLSKPVFAYITLKLIEQGLFSRSGESPESGLDRPLCEMCDFGPPHLREHPNYAQLTARTILSHQAGLPNWFTPGQPEDYIAEASTSFDYSGLGYCFLDEVIEHITEKSLHELSQEMFNSEPLNMQSSSFVAHDEGTPERDGRAIGHYSDETLDQREHFPRDQRPNPAVSLFTTAQDYARFLTVCTRDPFIRTHMFAPQIALAGKDQKAIDTGVSASTLEHLNWGLGIGLQTNEHGETIAFHWGDVETNRSFAAINLTTQKAVACFTNSANGPRIFQDVSEPVVGDMKYISQWLSQREGLEINPAQVYKLMMTHSLQKIAKSGHVPAVSYAYVESQEEAHQFSSTSVAVGKKNAQSSDANMNTVDDNTQFPASSLSKIVFTYLVLQMVKDGQIDLDEPLHDILPYERFLVNGEPPQKAKELTARHVLSHTAGLPNLGSDLDSPLKFDPKSKLGEGYSYSGEAILYLQKVIEAKMGKDLETLSREYVFAPLKMEHSTFIPPSEVDTNVVAVHTELGKPTAIYVGDPPQNAAGSLLTTGEDFSKLVSAWLENMDDPIIKQAFEPTNADDLMTCGLGWHIYRNEDEVIAYQFGENPNTRAFVAINLTEKKGAAFFTNSENGMSIANQVFNSPDLAPIGDMQAIYQHLHYTQSDEPGWQETISGKVAEVDGKFEEARGHFARALELSPEDESKQRRLEWFNTVHQPSPENKFTSLLKAFVGNYKNPYNDEMEMSIRDDDLIFKQFDQEIKLVRISDTEFLPEKDQSFKIRFDGNQMSISYVHGGPDKLLSKQPEPKSQAQYKEALRRLREESQPGYMRSTESSRAKERDKHIDTTTGPPWKL